MSPAEFRLSLAPDMTDEDASAYLYAIADKLPTGCPMRALIEDCADKSLDIIDAQAARDAEPAQRSEPVEMDASKFDEGAYRMLSRGILS